MSMEGIEQNPIVYDLMSEMAFHHRQVDLQVKFHKPFKKSFICNKCICLLFNMVVAMQNIIWFLR
jgi:formylmethanofuran dehydrogenase subunit E